MSEHSTISNAVPLGPVEDTVRGFQVIRFADNNGEPCSVQQSSAIMDYVDNEIDPYENPGSSGLWLGINKTIAQVMWNDALKLGVQTNETSGWVDYPIPEEVLVTTRMHLSREQVRSLISTLQNWVNTGELAKREAGMEAPGVET